MTDERINDDRGDLDLTKQIEVLKDRLADLQSIEETHKKLNQELHKEIWQWKEKAGKVAALESRVKQQQELIIQLSNDNRRLRK
tara:strand:+ start:386 stop:637 length:252 start_codon:yes stop_codon:yes gene_type:complete